MKNNDKYNIVKVLLQQGEKDLLIIGSKAGYKGSTEKRIKDSTKRLINSHLELKLLFKNLEEKELTEAKKENYYTPNKAAPKEDLPEIKGANTWEELVETHSNNTFITLLNKKLQDIENNKNYDNDNNTGDYTFVLDDKYLEIDQDDIVTASLRISRKTKKKLDKFAKEHGQYKKVLLVSQLIDEAIDKYN